jgi:hypothetical protein
MNCLRVPIDPHADGTVPVAHGEGSYVADPETIARLEGEGRVLFRCCAPDGTLDAAWNQRADRVRWCATEFISPLPDQASGT